VRLRPIEPSRPDEGSSGPPPKSSRRPSDAAAPGAQRSGDAKRAAAAEPKGSVAIAINPPVGAKYTSPSGPALERSAAADLPPGERPRMVNTRFFELDYDVDSVGPSGIGRVELWGTTDGGKNWRRLPVGTEKPKVLTVSVDDEGVYGFRMVVTNGAGLGGRPPVPGDLPDIWIGVDLTKPTARIASAQQGVDSEAQSLIISWQADDKSLAARPISLLFRQDPKGSWISIASGLENTGRYAWPIDSRTPSQLYLRLEVRDEAGNIGIHELAEPVSIDQSRPTARIREVRPLSETTSRPVQQR
jgi:hypothetical protein